MSAYKIETWLNKGYSLEEAHYQIKIRRPTNIEYYIHKFGVSYEEAVEMRDAYQKRSSSKSASLPIEERRKRTPRCIEYWMDKGLTKDEAIQEVSKQQSTFSLEKCIIKYGEIKGREIWQERQDKWQKTLNNKSDEEKQRINSAKNCKKIQKWIDKYGIEDGKIKYIDYLRSIGCTIFTTIEEIECHLLSIIQPLDVYLPTKKFIRKYIKSYWWELVERPKDINNWIETTFELKAPLGNLVYVAQSKRGFGGHYVMHVDNKFLRSGNEILFYIKLLEQGLQNNVDFIIEKYYDNSNMRCDFFLVKGNKYVELAGSTDEQYVQKMLFKEQTYNSIILWKQRDYPSFICEYIKQFYESNN